MAAVINKNTMKRLEILAEKSKLDVNDYLNCILDGVSDGEISMEYINELGKIEKEMDDGEFMTLDDL